MDIETLGFVIGLIGAVYMKASISLMRYSESRPELRMIGREPENPALGAFLKGLLLILIGLTTETYARLFFP
jgi:hypothetical protein